MALLRQCLMEVRAAEAARAIRWTAVAGSQGHGADPQAEGRHGRDCSQGAALQGVIATFSTPSRWWAKRS